MEYDCHQILEHIPHTTCQYLTDNQLYDLHVCFATFVAEDAGDLSLTKDDIIIALSQVNEHWLQGQVCYDSQSNSWSKLARDEQLGTFPVNHCYLLESEKVKLICEDKLKLSKLPTTRAYTTTSTTTATNTTSYTTGNSQTSLASPTLAALTFPTTNTFTTAIAHSSSLSSGSSSLHSSDHYQHNSHYQQQRQTSQPPPRPAQLPRQIIQRQQPPAILQQQTPLDTVDHLQVQVQKQPSPLLTGKQQYKLKGWLHLVKKKTARLSTRITASLGLISLTRDEEFERHYEHFKHTEKTIRIFIKNLTTFVEHFENFLLSLQSTSDNLSDFYRDRAHQKELDELRKKNKALACEHFHTFKRTVDRQVITVANQLLQKFSGPQQLISKRSVKLLDYDNRSKELESCRDLEKKEALRDQYVIAKDVYDKINQQLKDELPLFNQFALNIFRECIMVLLESRKNLINSYTRQTAGLLNTPLMMTYTASDVAASILMSACDPNEKYQQERQQNLDINELLEQERKDNGHTCGQEALNYGAIDNDLSRPHSSASQLSSEFNQMALEAREISSTPLSHITDTPLQMPHNKVVAFDEPDAGLGTSDGLEVIKKKHVAGLFASNDSKDSEDGTEGPIKKDLSRDRRKKRKPQIYIASWPFVATGPNQLTIACNQTLKLVKGSDECGNSDWSLVQDKKGQLGYVPTSYIAKKEDIRS